MVYLQLFWAFFKIGGLTFGGGYAMLPMIEREIVKNRGWLKNEDVIDIFAVSQGLPGAIALNSATQIGFRVKGILGSLVSVLGAVTPSLIIITLIAAVLSAIWGSALLAAAFNGIGVAVTALILSTVIKFFKSSVTDIAGGIIFGVSLLCSLLLPVSPFIYVLAGIAVGIVIGLFKKREGNRDGGER